MGKRLDDGFDDLSRALAETTSRRTALRLLAATAAGGILSAVGATSAAAACKRVGRSCFADTECCTGRCSPETLECCKVFGKNCSANAQCCTGICRRGKCACKATGRSCTRDLQCCSLNCSGGTCAEGQGCSPTQAECGTGCCAETDQCCYTEPEDNWCCQAGEACCQDRAGNRQCCDPDTEFCFYGEVGCMSRNLSCDPEEVCAAGGQKGCHLGCSCVPTTHGIAFCAEKPPQCADVQSCETNADCPAGSHCGPIQSLANICCGLKCVTECTVEPG